MRQSILVLVLGLAVSACTQQPNSATVAGAAAAGAATGAAIGANAAAATISGEPAANQCIYRRTDGSRFFGACN